MAQMMQDTNDPHGTGGNVDYAAQSTAWMNAEMAAVGTAAVVSVITALDIATSGNPLKGLGTLIKSGWKKLFTKGADDVAETGFDSARKVSDTKTGHRAVSKAEAEDIKETGEFRQKPDGKSMEDKWFSETPEGAEAQKKLHYPDDAGATVVEAEVPKSVYDDAYKNPNIDGTGPGFVVPEADLPKVKPKPSE